MTSSLAPTWSRPEGTVYPGGMVLAVVEPPADSIASDLKSRLRSVTSSWSRYGYRGEIVLAGRVDEALDRALEMDGRWCLVQRAGHVLAEHWPAPRSGARSVTHDLAHWTGEHRFLAMGDVTGTRNGFGLADRFLLVDLRVWAELGRPRYEAPTAERTPRVACEKRTLKDGSCRLVPCEGAAPAAPSHPPGWRLVDASLQAGIPVHGTPSPIAERRVDLWPLGEGQAAVLRRHLGSGIVGSALRGATEPLSSAQDRFLSGVATQVANARRGVFLFNIESSDDVLDVPDGFEPPLGALYAVAAGFKPNLILDRLEFDASTRVVFFDYSANALAVREMLRSRWDGRDLPSFIEAVFCEHPPPETYYQLWDGATPATVDRHDIEDRWACLLDLWGGEDAFAQHWQRYRELDHEYVECDLLSDPGALLRRVHGGDRAAAIWWSNAFFTVYGNWLHPERERELRFERFAGRLAALDPGLWLYGSDHLNRSVNHTQAHRYGGRLITGTAGSPGTSRHEIWT